ncbi:MAG TPA: putative Ig domain-containing protein [Candidatus Acidoferrales bacterium]|nr:putative Ig domain-containing protein [Candidatus Acidoferrales bacterium]
MQSRHSLKLLRPAACLALACGLALLGTGCGGNGTETLPPPVTIPPFITATNLPDGVVGVAYSATVTVVGGASPLTFSVTVGMLPAGLSLNTTTGEITGTPTTAEVQTFTIRVADSQSRTDEQQYTVRIGAAASMVELMSVATGGGPSNSDSGDPVLSDDGRFVAFTSFSTNLIASDTNGVTDIFLRDRACNQTLRVSVATDGTAGDKNSFGPSLSALTGGVLFVAYTSDATNLVPMDTNNTRDVFITALTVSGCTVTPVSTARVSVATAGGVPPTTATLFSSSTIGSAALAMTSGAQVDKLVELVAGTGAGQVREITANDATTLTVSPAWTTVPDNTTVFHVIAEGNNISTTPHVAANTLHVAFHSIANNLDQADFNGQNDVFVTDLNFTGGALSVVRTRRVGLLRANLANGVPRTTANIFSETTIGSVALNMAPGGFVGKLVELVAGTGSGQTRQIVANDSHILTVASPWDVVPNNTTIFDVATANDVTADIFTDTTIGNMSLTMMDDEHNGRLVEIVSGTGAGQIRLIVDGTNTTFTVGTGWDPDPDGTSAFRVLAQISGGATRGRLSADGARVAYNASPAEIGVLVENVASRDAQRASLNILGGAATAASFSSLSANGNRVLFLAGDSNIVDGDTNGVADLFLRDLTALTSTRINLASDGTQTNANTDVLAEMSGGTRLIAFTSFANNLVTDDRNGARDVFLRDTMAGTTVRMSQGMGGTNPNGESFDGTISLDGSTIAFQSAATNLFAGDITGSTAQRDVFVVCSNGSLGYPCAGILDPPMIVVGGLPAAQLGTPYSASVQAAGGAKPLHWAVTEGLLPPGLFLNSTSGLVSGLPQKAGRYTFTIEVTDAGRPMRRAAKQMTVTVE